MRFKIEIDKSDLTNNVINPDTLDCKTEREVGILVKELLSNCLRKDKEYNIIIKAKENNHG